MRLVRAWTRTRLGPERRRARATLNALGPSQGWRLRTLSVRTPGPARRATFACRRAGHPDLVVKVYGDAAEGRREAAALAEIRDAGTAVHPVLSDPDMGCLVFPLIPGRTVQGSLFGADHHFAIAQAGKALRRYHDAVPAVDAAYPAVDLLGEEIDAWMRAGRELPHARLVRAHAENRTAAAAGARRVHTHFDFKPANVILGPDGPRIIDRPRPGTDWIETDIGGFLAALAQQRVQSGIDRTLCAGGFRSDQDAFLGAYGYRAEGIDVLRLSMVCKFLLIWLKEKRRNGGLVGRPSALDQWVEQFVRTS